MEAPIDPKCFASAEHAVDAELLAEPQRYLERLRATEGDFIPSPEGVLGGLLVPFLRSPKPNRPTFVAVGYENMKSILPDVARFHQDYDLTLAPLMGETQLNALNPPRHTKYRALITKAFGAKTVNEIGNSAIEPLASALLKRLAARGGGELIGDLACRIPVIVMSQIFDLPRRQYARFAELATGIMAFAYRWDEAYAASRAMRVLILELMDQRRGKPGNDLLSQLQHTEIDGDKLSDEDILAFALALIPAGIETTTRALGTLFAALLCDPSRYQRLRDDPSVVPAAVEEILRWNGPAQMVPKQAVVDIQVGDRIIPAGASIWCALGHANRDPRSWERPDEIDFDRSRRRSLTFSNGPHSCIGHVLARKELETTLALALRLIPDLRLNPECTPPKILGVLFRSPDQCHVICTKNQSAS